MQKFKLMLIIVLLFAISGIDVCSASTWFGIEKIEPELIGESNKLDSAVQNYIAYLITFLYIVATIYGIYGGSVIFNSGSSSDSDGQIKKGKRIIVQSLIGIVVIFLAGSIINFVFDTLYKSNGNTEITTTP